MNQEVKESMTRHLPTVRLVLTLSTILFCQLSSCQAQQPWTEVRQNHMHTQKSYWDCGPAAAATLLLLLEAEVPPFPTDPQPTSLAWLQDWLSTASIESAGYRIDGSTLWDFFEQPGFLPILLHLSHVNSEDQGHFVTAVATEGPWILLADPRDGWQWEHRNRLEDMWSGYVLVPLLHRRGREPTIVEKQRLRLYTLTDRRIERTCYNDE